MPDSAYIFVLAVPAGHAVDTLLQNPEPFRGWGLPALVILGLLLSFLYLKSDLLISGILGVLTGVLASIWTLATFEDKGSNSNMIWALILLLHWSILAYTMLKKRRQKR
jgi:hypothetical protein